MKKLMCVVLSAVLCVCTASFAAGCAKRGEQLKLFSQGEYMDEDLFEEFEAWYKEQTGETVKVTMDDFLSNEDLYTKLTMDKADYDLVCVSDYMVEQLIREDLCVPVDKERVDIAQAGLFKPEFIEATRAFDPELSYSVPYMFGTFGIMYNRNEFAEPLDSWADIFEGPRDKMISLKASARDTYHAASLYVQRNRLAGLSGEAQKTAVQNVFSAASDANIAAVRQAIGTWRGNGSNRMWDDENGKTDCAENKCAAGLYWSCDAGYVMNAYEKDDGTLMPGNKNLWFVIPEEGGNVYLDSFVMSKYAENTKAAGYFLEFLCTKAAAKANSIYCGSMSPVAAAYDELKAEYEAMNLTDDGSIFKGTSEEWKRMFIDMTFPPAEVLNRCGQMRAYEKSAEAKVIQAIADEIYK